MKITVKINNVEISIDEDIKGDRASTLRYSDQSKLVQETIVVIAEQCLKLQQSVNQ
jgi:hypothetical protein